MASVSGDVRMPRGLPRGQLGLGDPLEEAAVSRLPFLCSIGGTGGWSAKGCELLSRNRTHVVCQCSHTTSFAVLMDVSRREVGAAPTGSPAHLASVSRDESLCTASLPPDLPPQRVLSSLPGISNKPSPRLKPVFGEAGQSLPGFAEQNSLERGCK